MRGLIFRITLPARRYWWNLKISYWEWQLKNAINVMEWAHLNKDAEAYELAYRAAKRRNRKLYQLSGIDL